MKKAHLLLFFSIITLLTLKAQTTPNTEKESVYAEEDLYEDDPYYWSHSREIGVNFTPLISKLVPFNLGQNNAGNIGLIYKKYYSKRAFRLSFGAHLVGIDDDPSPDNKFIYLGLGIERRYPISKDKKLAYTSAWEIFLNASNIAVDNAFGFKKIYGFEYHLSKRIFVSTEGALSFGINPDGDGPFLNFQLPLAIFVNVRLY
jgi:hypothetical protein